MQKLKSSGRAANSATTKAWSKLALLHVSRARWVNLSASTQASNLAHSGTASFTPQSAAYSQWLQVLRHTQMSYFSTGQKYSLTILKSYCTIYGRHTKGNRSSKNL